MRQRVKSGFANAGLVLLSLAIFYLLAELVFFRLGLPHLSLNLRPHIPDRADFFLQNSKANYVPRDYVALVGDSYAQGMGDWLLASGGKNDRPYHSADVLHGLLGRDVVTLGRAASGSAEAMVLRMTRIFGDSYCYLFPRLEEPRRLLVYFYEGNDIDDNNQFLLKHALDPGSPDLRDRIDRVLDEDYGRVSAWRCHGHLGDTIFRMVRFAVRYRFSPPQVIDRAPNRNRVLVAGQPVGTAEMQVPAPASDARLIEAGVAVYDRSLAWLRRHFPAVPTTVVYIPSPAAMYRHAGTEVVAKDAYLPEESQRAHRPVLVDDRRFPVSAVYRNSQQICDSIRAATLAQAVGFIDARPALRAAAAGRPLHGPRDWNHLNEEGYRLLAGLLARRIDERPDDACEDWAGP